MKMATRLGSTLNILICILVLTSMAYSLKSMTLQVCISISPPAACDMLCDGINATCSQACSKVNCSMNCTENTDTCKQICGRPSCALGVCSSKNGCRQICQAEYCPEMHCHSPKKCEFEVPVLGGPENRFKCHNENADCSLECLNANCVLESNSIKNRVLCQNGTCLVNLKHETAETTINCVSGANCTIMHYDTANVNCTGPCNWNTMKSSIPGRSTQLQQYSMIYSLTIIIAAFLIKNGY